MINSTNENIRFVAFRLFLEKGYEATNIRDICKEVQIKPSSLYFYYKSKQELFFTIYDEIWEKELEYIDSLDDLLHNTSPDLKLYYLYRNLLLYHLQDIVKQKFLLRYHLYPSSEISKFIRERFLLWTEKKDQRVMKIINECLNVGIIDDCKPTDYYLERYKRFANAQIIEMIISNVKKSDAEIKMSWISFWNGVMTNEPTE